MTAEDLTHLHNLLAARIVRNRLVKTGFDPQINLAELLLSVLQGSADISNTSFKRNTKEVSNIDGHIVGIINRGRTFDITIDTWN